MKKEEWIQKAFEDAEHEYRGAKKVNERVEHWLEAELRQRGRTSKAMPKQRTEAIGIIRAGLIRR